MVFLVSLAVLSSFQFLVCTSGLFLCLASLALYLASLALCLASLSLCWSYKSLSLVVFLVFPAVKLSSFSVSC